MIPYSVLLLMKVNQENTLIDRSRENERALNFSLETLSLVSRRHGSWLDRPLPIKDVTVGFIPPRLGALADR